MLNSRNPERVVSAVNAIGRDNRHYTLMMLGCGVVVARRLGHNSQGLPFGRIIIWRRIGLGFRDYETLLYVAYLAGFTAVI